MCQYCGCRDMPLLRDYTAEHERAMNLGGDAVRALDAGDVVHAREFADLMAVELRSHWQGEEDGLFVELQASDEMFTDYIEPLVTEHRELDAFLRTMDLATAADQATFRTAVFDLHEHIAKEEDALFPASVTTLDGEQWDSAIAAWQRAHPGSMMLGSGI